ncbi:hypothetical protein OU798_11540 [Prolixibacteraceae bacterium Z1-6]|uniref:Outer membrane protein beta-barrel domain-containing protein n=1 Tax=Draconibacterium aestuarii TaxID=2998507 RepID=A0A9X3F5Q4_9BACT|nr:hypothetical protein [Prolixibacteraceae bacterium Z1-6]
MSDRLNIDKSIRDKFDNFSEAPPSHVWNNIQGQLAAQKRKKRMAYIGWISAAAVVVFAVLAGWYLNDQKGEVAPMLAEQEIVQEQKKETTLPVASDVAEPVKEAVLLAEKPTSETSEQRLNVQEAATEQLTDEEFETYTVLLAAGERKDYNLLDRVEAIFQVKQADVDLAEFQKKPRREQGLTLNDQLLIAENARNLKNRTKAEHGWTVGAHLSPGYSSHSASHEQQYAENITYSGNDGNANVGGGFSVQYKTGKRLRVESGVYYSKDGQSASNSSRSLFRFNSNSDYMYADVAPANGGVESFSNVVKLSSEGLAMNSTAGVINMRSTPQGVVITTNAEFATSEATSIITTNGEFSQVFEFVEIPLTMRYSLLDKKFRIDVMGGLNAGVVVGNNAYIENDFGKQNIGKTEDISRINFSGTVGVGVNYALGKHLSMAVEPRLNYYINSINSNPYVDYRPYRVGVYTGLYYSF